MGFTIQQEEEDALAACRFHANAELKDVWMLDCSAQVEETDARPAGKLSLGLKIETAVLRVTAGTARISVQIAVFGDPGTPSERPDRHYFEVASRFALLYDLLPGYTPPNDEVNAFKEGNAVFHCWPYARELVQSLTMRMGMPIPPLPMLRLLRKVAPKKQATKRASKTKPKLAESDG